MSVHATAVSDRRTQALRRAFCERCEDPRAVVVVARFLVPFATPYTRNSRASRAIAPTKWSLRGASSRRSNAWFVFGHRATS
jgi:hypothetical protein